MKISPDTRPLEQRRYPNNGLPWDDADIEVFRQMWLDGCTDEQMIATFMRSPAALQARAHKEGIYCAVGSRKGWTTDERREADRRYYE